MTHKLPFRQLFVSDRLTDMERRRLTWAQAGLLSALEDTYWLAGELPAAIDEVARLLGVLPADMASLMVVLDRFFPIADGARRHVALDEELALARLRHDKHAKGGRETAAKRWRNRATEQIAEQVAELPAKQVAEQVAELPAKHVAEQVAGHVASRTRTRTRSTVRGAVKQSSSQGEERCSSEDRSAGQPRTAPPADAGKNKGDRNGNGTPHAIPGATATVRRFLEMFYREPGKRRVDVVTQLEGSLCELGARLDRATRVRAVDSRHLDEACREVLDDPPRDPDKAIVFVLKKLRDSRLEVLSARTKAAEVQRGASPGSGPVRVGDAIAGAAA